MADKKPPHLEDLPADATETLLSEAMMRRQNLLLSGVDAVQRQWKVAAVIFGVLLIVGGTYVALIPDKYAATGVIAFQPRKGQDNGRDLVSQLASRYPEDVTSSVSVGEAAIASGATAEQIRSGLVATIDPGTLNLVMTVTLESPEEALAAAQSLYLSGMRVNASDPYLQALPVNAPAEVVEANRMPKPLLYATVLALAGLMGVLGAALADWYVRARRRAAVVQVLPPTR